MDRGAGLARGKRLAPVSAKREAERDEREAVRQRTFNRDGRRCVAHEFVPLVPCPEESRSAPLQCDEIQGRGREPGSHLDDTKTQTLCWKCHTLKTNYPRVAGLLGLYGREERERRTAEEAPGAWEEALAEWARRKAQLTGLPVALGDLLAVRRYWETQR